MVALRDLIVLTILLSCWFVVHYFVEPIIASCTRLHIQGRWPLTELTDAATKKLRNVKGRDVLDNFGSVNSVFGQLQPPHITQILSQAHHNFLPDVNSGMLPQAPGFFSPHPQSQGQLPHPHDQQPYSQWQQQQPRSQWQQQPRSQWWQQPHFQWWQQPHFQWWQQPHFQWRQQPHSQWKQEPHSQWQQEPYFQWRQQQQPRSQWQQQPHFQWRQQPHFQWRQQPHSQWRQEPHSQWQQEPYFQWRQQQPHSQWRQQPHSQWQQLPYSQSLVPPGQPQGGHSDPGGNFGTVNSVPLSLPPSANEGAGAILRRALGLRAKDILLKYAYELPRRLQHILTSFKRKLVQEKIIENEAVDLYLMGVSDQDKAAKLYDAVMNVLEFNPDKFANFVNILRSFLTFDKMVDELEQAGKDAGLFGDDVFMPTQPPTSNNKQLF